MLTLAAARQREVRLGYAGLMMMADDYFHGDTVPARLRSVTLHEYTENVPREHNPREHNPNTGRCGAMPAHAFRTEYPNGCRRERGHEGSHSGVVKSAHTLDRKARMRGWRPE